MEQDSKTELGLKQYLLGQLTAEDRQQLEEELAKSEEDFEQLLLAEEELVDEYVSGTLSEQEVERFERHFLTTPGRHLKLQSVRALRRYTDEHPPVSFWARVSQQIRQDGSVVNGMSRPRQLLRPAIAVLALCFGSFWGVRLWQTALPIYQAENLLKQNYRVYMEGSPRPSGGYQVTGESVLMSPTGPQARNAYLARALDLVEEASANGADADKVHEVRARIFLIQGNLEEALKELKLIGATRSDTASVLNDRGVLHFKEKAWLESEKYFEAAVKQDPQFKEAWYNLALVRAQLGKKTEASSSLDQYLTLEADPSWKNAALELKKKLAGN